MSILQRAVIAATLLMVGCASAPPQAQEPVVVERKVYVFVPEESVPIPPGPGIAPSPLVVAAEQERQVRHEQRVALEAARQPEIVYVPTERDYWPGHYYPGAYVAPVYRQPEPETTVVVVHDHDRKRHRVNHHSTARERRIERKVESCGRRGSEWARKRCIKQAAR